MDKIGIIADNLTDANDRGVQWLVCDVQIEEHLVWITTYVARLSRRVVWIGSVDLAESSLPDVLQLQPTADICQEVQSVERVLVVSASMSQVTHKQIAQLLAQDDVQSVELDPVSVFAAEDGWQQEKRQLVDQLVQIYKRGNKAVLYVVSNPENRLSMQHVGDRLNLHCAEVSKRISQALGEVASEIVANPPFVTGLVLTGEDTAKDVCREIGATSLQFVHEIEPGIQLGKLEVKDRELLAIIKEGAAGREDSLVHVVRVLRGSE